MGIQPGWGEASANKPWDYCWAAIRASHSIQDLSWEYWSSNLFEITKEENRFKLKRKAQAISRLMNRMGNTILLTNNSELDREDLLTLYRRKDALEKMFDIIKNELEGGRLKVSSREAMEGRIFLTYLSLILYSELSRIMKEKNLYKTYTLTEVFYELKKA